MTEAQAALARAAVSLRQALTLFSRPVLLVPFLVWSAFEGTLVLLYVNAPTPPLSALGAALVRHTFGANYLHYPLHVQAIPDVLLWIRGLTLIVAAPTLMRWSVRATKARIDAGDGREPVGEGERVAAVWLWAALIASAAYGLHALLGAMHELRFVGRFDALWDLCDLFVRPAALVGTAVVVCRAIATDSIFTPYAPGRDTATLVLIAVACACVLMPIDFLSKRAALYVADGVPQLAGHAAFAAVLWDVPARFFVVASVACFSFGERELS